MNSLPIGIFDYGIGGLTVLRAIRERLPGENIVYLGDTARVPYGNKSPATVGRYAVEDAQFLLGKGVKMIVVACNTASALAAPALRAQFPGLPVLGMIGPGARAAVAATTGRRIGVIATAATPLMAWFTGGYVPPLLYVPIIVAAAAVGGLLPGLLATALGAGASLIFLFEQDGFDVTDPKDPIRLAFLIGTGVLVSWLLEIALRQRRRMGEEREQLRVTLASIGGILHLRPENFTPPPWFLILFQPCFRIVDRISDGFFVFEPFRIRFSLFPLSFTLFLEGNPSILLNMRKYITTLSACF